MSQELLKPRKSSTWPIQDWSLVICNKGLLSFAFSCYIFSVTLKGWPRQITLTTLTFRINHNSPPRWPCSLADRTMENCSEAHTVGSNPIVRVHNLQCVSAVMCVGTGHTGVFRQDYPRYLALACTKEVSAAFHVCMFCMRSWNILAPYSWKKSPSKNMQGVIPNCLVPTRFKISGLFLSTKKATDSYILSSSAPFSFITVILNFDAGQATTLH